MKYRWLFWHDKRTARLEAGNIQDIDKFCIFALQRGGRHELHHIMFTTFGEDYTVYGIEFTWIVLRLAVLLQNP